MELGVDPAERIERRTFDAGLGCGRDLPQRGLDVVAARPSVGLPQPLEVIEGSAGQGREARPIQEGQTARRASGMEHHGGGDTVEVVCLPYGGAEVVHEHPEPLVLRGSGVEGGDWEAALVCRPQGLGLAVEGFLGVLENGCGAVGEGDAFDAGHAPDANLGTFGRGLPMRAHRSFSRVADRLWAMGVSRGLVGSGAGARAGPPRSRTGGQGYSAAVTRWAGTGSIQLALNSARSSRKLAIEAP
ncbi:hypothetical protein SMICM304S_02437 [Streptomyces microflavus]